MRRVRVIPVLTLQKGGLVKGVKFQNHQYIGDPINTVKIFNDKEVDELAVIDIDPSRERTAIRYELIREIVSEAFMPIAYGGGIKNMEDIRRIFSLGVEKVIINSAAATQPDLLQQAAAVYGSQSIVVSIDYKRNWLGKKKVYLNGGSKSTTETPVAFAKKVAAAGAGEIILTCIDREGSFAGYDLETLQEVCSAVEVPVIAHGGAAETADFLKAVIEGGASAVAAGSRFVFTGKKKGILINYPASKELKEILYANV